jgi:hypothetical protein
LEVEVVDGRETFVSVGEVQCHLLKRFAENVAGKLMKI